MTIPVSSETSQELWNGFVTRGRSVRGNLQKARDNIQSGDNRSITGALQACLAVSDVLVAAYKARNNPRLVQIAKDQLNDDTFDLAVEALAVEDACAACIDWFEANFPADGNGNLLMQKWDRDGSAGVPRSMSLTTATLTQQQSNAVVTQLDTVLSLFT